MKTEDEMFLWRMAGRSNGKCAMEREILKKAKLIKQLKKKLSLTYNIAMKELAEHRDNKNDCQYIRGYVEAIKSIEWFIYQGEHENEN